MIVLYLITFANSLDRFVGPGLDPKQFDKVSERIFLKSQFFKDDKKNPQHAELKITSTNVLTKDEYT